MTEIGTTLSRIKAQLGPAQLIAVSKKQPIAVIEQALRAGQRVFGENRVQEAQSKFPYLRAAYPDIELHLIGPLQTNKAQEAVTLFDVIQTLDRPRLVDALAAAMERTGRKPKCYIEINIGKEQQKTGINADELDEFLGYCATRGLAIQGLMCIPPQGEDPSPYFMKMRALADRHALPHLSMGMSADYETAIRCGATEVRIGTALFGAR